MCISKRTSTAHCAYIMRGACSLDIQMAARGGSSTTQPQSAQSSLNVLILMSTLLLLCPHPLHQMSKLLHLCYNSLLSTILGLLFLFTDDTLVLLIVQYYHTITHSLSSWLLLHLMSSLDDSFSFTSSFFYSVLSLSLCLLHPSLWAGPRY